MKRSFEYVIKSIVYVGAGILFLGTVFDAISNAIALVNLKVAVWGTILIFLLWASLFLMMRHKKPYWGEVRLSRPNRQINLFVLGMIGLLWLPMLIPSKPQDNSPNTTTPTKPKDVCYKFPADFDSTKLYILITRFEDYTNPDNTKCYGAGIKDRIDVLRSRDSLPIEICYKDSISPTQSDDADRIRDYYGADIIIWGRLSNANNNCEADGLCLNYKPSEKLIHYAGGQVPKKVDLDFQPKISYDKINKGLISMGEDNFDAWLVDLVNLKIGKKQPEFYRISTDWSTDRQAREFCNRGDLFFDIGLLNNARNDYGNALKLNPNYVDAYIKGGLVILMLGHVEECISTLTQAIKLDPNNGNLYRIRGLAMSMLDNTEAALLDFSKVVEINPTDAEAYRNRGNAKFLIGQKDSAISDYTKAIEIAPEDEGYYISRGIANWKSKHEHAAILDFTKAIDINPKNESSYIQRANVYSDLGDYNSSIKDLKKAIQINSKNEVAYHNLGNAQKAMKQNEEAILNYNKSIEMNSQNPVVYIARGSIYRELELNEMAITDYLKSLEFDSNNVDAYNNIGVAKNALNQPEAAIPYFSKAIEINPKFAHAHSGRGNAWLRLGQSEKAIADFDQTIKLQSNYENAYVGRGQAKNNLGQLHAAISDISKAIELKPKDIHAIRSRGIIYCNLGLYDAGIIDFTNAIEIQSDFIHAYENRSLAYLEKGETSKYLIDKLRIYNLKLGWLRYPLILLLGLTLFYRQRILKTFKTISGKVINFKKFKLKSKPPAGA